MKLVTIKIFDDPIKARILKSKLENEGVNCFLFDENIVSINPLYNITVGGIKLKISEADAEKVRKIIAEVENTPLTNDENEPFNCPNCESSNLISGYKSMKGILGVIGAIISFLFMVFPIYYNIGYKCNDCGNEFNN